MNRITTTKNLCIALLLAASVARAQADDQSQASDKSSNSKASQSDSADTSKNSSATQSNSNADNSNSSKSNQSNSSSDNANPAKSDSAKAADAGAPVVSPVQAKADPGGLNFAGKVMLGGSDVAAKDFQQKVLPSLAALLKTNGGDHQNKVKDGAVQIDPNKLRLSTKADVRAYFVSGGPTFQNAIGFDAITDGKAPKNLKTELGSDAAKLIFGNAATSVNGLADGSSQNGVRTASEPLLSGDFVDVGTMAKGARLDFFSIANSASQAGGSDNSNDGLAQHAARFTGSVFTVPSLNSPYIFLSFANLWGDGKQDANNTIIALDIGQANTAALLATPEPSMWLTLGTLLAAAIWAKRRLDRTNALAR